MRDDEAGSVEVLKHVLDDVFGVEIQVVGWFVHDDDVGLGQEHLGEGDFGPLSSGEGFYVLLHLVSRDEESSEHGADLILLSVVFAEFRQDACVPVQIREYLRV